MKIFMKQIHVSQGYSPLKILPLQKEIFQIYLFLNLIREVLRTILPKKKPKKINQKIVKIKLKNQNNRHRYKSQAL